MRLAWIGVFARFRGSENGARRGIPGLTALFRVHTHFSPDSCGTNRTGQQIPHANQVVGRCREGEHPSHLLDAAMPDLAHQSYRLPPPEALFDALAFPLTDRIASMSRRPRVNRTAAVPIYVLRHLRRHVQIPALGDEVPGVVTLVGPHRDAPRAGYLL